MQAATVQKVSRSFAGGLLRKILKLNSSAAHEVTAQPWHRQLVSYPWLAQGLLQCLFDIWDQSRAGSIDRRELYCGLLLVAHAEYAVRLQQLTAQQPISTAVHLLVNRTN